MAEDGGQRAQISQADIFNLNAVSPDGEWAIVATKADNDQGAVIKVYPMTGNGPPTTICDVCGTRFGPGRTGAPLISWSRDESTMMVSLQYLGMRSKNTLALSIHPGEHGSTVLGYLRTKLDRWSPTLIPLVVFIFSAALLLLGGIGLLTD